MTNMQTLLHRLVAAPDYYGLDIKRKERVVSACREFLDTLVRLQSDDTLGRDLWNEIEEVLGKLGDASLFMEASPHSRINLEYQQNLARLMHRFRNTDAIHLELGVSTAWPQERADDYVRGEAIGDVIRLDMNPDVDLDMVASATALPFRAATIDRISSTSVFEHLAYPHEVLCEAYRVLRPGGVILTNAPFHFVEHAWPDDYLRYTGSFFKEVCTEIGFAEVYVDTRSTSGLYYTLHQLAKGTFVASHIEPASRRFGIEFHVGIMALLIMGQVLDRDLIGEGGNHWHSTLAVAVKGGEYQPPAARIDRTVPYIERHRNIFACPRTHKNLFAYGQDLASEDGSVRYKVINGIPQIAVPHTEAFERVLRGGVC